MRQARTPLLAAAMLAGVLAVAPLVWTADPAASGAAPALLPPCLAHPLGTDALGRDALARLLDAARDTVSAAIPAMLLSLALGTAYGVTAGLAPALASRALRRLLDALLALPPLLVLLCGAALLPLSLGSVILLVGCALWPPLARLVQAEVSAARLTLPVIVARRLGAGMPYLARRHILPGLGRLLGVQATFLTGDAILALATLSFLGLGAPPPAAGLGALLQSGLGLATLGAWWLILPPALLIILCLFLASAIGRAMAA